MNEREVNYNDEDENWEDCESCPYNNNLEWNEHNCPFREICEVNR